MKEATLQKIATLTPIPGADRIESATLQGLGWSFVVQKGKFAPGDACVFFAIDSLLPEGKPWTAFLEKKGKEFLRIHSMRFKGALSQGLALPIHDLIPDFDTNRKFQDWAAKFPGDKWCESWGDKKFNLPPPGFDVTEFFGVRHFEKPIPEGMEGDPKGNMPGCIPRTKETMLQDLPGILKAMEGQEIVITVKCDGTSGTFARLNGELYVCGRHWAFNETPDDIYWRVFRRYGLDKILEANEGIAIQAEVVGPGLGGNKLKLPDIQMRVFDVWDIGKAEYWGHHELAAFCRNNNLPMVPVDEITTMEGEKLDIGWWLKKAEGLYEGTSCLREGIVVRTTKAQYLQEVNNRASFKVFNNTSLEEDEK
jgi:hypothetical protein